MMSSLLFLVAPFCFHVLDSQLTWTELVPTSTEIPAARYRSAIAYDKVHEILIISGGSSSTDDNPEKLLNDTWIFNTTSLEWTELNTINNPTSRFDAIGGYNEATQQFIISTGEGVEDFFNDIWALPLGDYSASVYEWVRLDANTKGRPNVRYGIAGGLSTTEPDIFYVSHGFASQRFSDTFKFNISSPSDGWKEVFEGTNSYTPYLPHARCLVGTSPAPYGFTMFGGCLAGGLAGGPCPALDNWIYNEKKKNKNGEGGWYSGWKQLDDSPVPNINADSCIYWNNEDKTLVYGGEQDIKSTQKIGGNNIKRNEIHIVNINNGKWKSYKTKNSPSELLHHHRMVQTNDGCILYSGINDKNDDELAKVYLLSGTISSKDEIDQSEFSYFSVLYLHGIFMWFSWGTCLQLGGFIARYFRYYDPWWFKPMHLWCQRIGNVCSVLGIMFAFLGQGDPNFTHGIIGILILCLAVIQGLSGEFRPHHGDKYRWLFELFHKNNGRILLMLGLINISLGVFLIVAPPGVWIMWYIQFFAIVVFYIVFELNKRKFIKLPCIKLKEDKKNDETPDSNDSKANEVKPLETE